MSEFSEIELNNLYDEVWESTEAPKNPNLETLDCPEERYEIKELLGQGAMKKVYRAYDHFACREIALAKLNEADNNLHLDLFLHEARLTSQLEHPNIIQVHDIALDTDKTPYFTMDLKIGQNLQELTISPDSSIEEINKTLNIFLKVCTALSYAHSKGIIHLDLKPENIQIGSYGEVIICDWGLGTTVNKLSIADTIDNPFHQSLLISKTARDKITGTPGFMAPEQYELDSKNDEKSDIFSLGALLYYLLTSQTPFSGTLEEIKEQTQSGRFPSPSELNSQVPNALDAICQKALSPLSDDRYPTVEALLDDLQKYLNGYTTTAEKTGFLTETKRLIQRNRTISTLLICGSILISTLTALFIHSLEKSRSLEALARKESEEALLLYENERTAHEKLDKEFIAKLEDDAKDLRYQFFYRDPVFTIKSAIKKQKSLLKIDPKNPEYNRTLVHFYLCSLKLQQASELVEYTKGYELESLRDFFKEINPEFLKKKKFSADELAEIIKVFRETSKNRQQLIQKIIIYDKKVRKNKKNYAPVIKEVLAYYNRKWSSKKWLYDGKQNKLTITGHEFNKVSYSHEGRLRTRFLTFLNIKELNLSGTRLFSPSQLNGLKELKSLNISNTLIKQSLNFKEFPKLHTLILSKNQLSEKQLAKIPKRVTVKFQD